MNQKEFFITLGDGTRVPVTADVYYEITRSDEREKNSTKEKRRGCSLWILSMRRAAHCWITSTITIIKWLDKQRQMRPEDALLNKESDCCPKFSVI